MRILLVDDHRLVADAMAMLLQDLANEVKVTICHTTQRALTLIDEKATFDLILTDMFMPGIDGLGFMHGLKSRQVHTPVIIISSSDDQKLIRTVYEQGAQGYIQKSLPGSEMLKALRRVLGGERYYPADYVPSTNMRPTGDETVYQADQQPNIGPRQREVLYLMASGNSNKQIAQIMEISEATVKYHTSLLFKALEVSNRTSCIHEGQRLNLIRGHSDRGVTQLRDG